MAGRGPSRNSRDLGSEYTYSSSYEYDSDYMTNTDLSDVEGGYTNTIIKGRPNPNQAIYRSPYYNQQKKQSCCKKFMKRLVLLVVLALFGYCILSFLVSLDVIKSDTPVARGVTNIENQTSMFFKKAFSCQFSTPNTDDSLKGYVKGTVESMKGKVDAVMNNSMEENTKVATETAHNLAETVNTVGDQAEANMKFLHSAAQKNKFADCALSLCVVTVFCCGLWGIVTKIISTIYKNHYCNFY